MKNSMMFAVAVGSMALAIGACKKKEAATGDTGSGSGSAVVVTPPAGSGSSGSGSGSGSAVAAAPAGGDSLESASWKTDKAEQKAGPLKFDREVWTDDGNGNLQLWAIANCPTAPKDCSFVQYDHVKGDALQAICKDYSWIHLAISPTAQGAQKANMGPLKVPAGSYGSKSEPFRTMIEYTNHDGNIGGQSYVEKDMVKLTQVTDTTIAGTFDTSADEHYKYKGAFTATKCTCDPAAGECK